MTWAEILNELRNKPTVDVPTAGAALAELSRSGSYVVAKGGRFPVPILEVGGRLRVPSIAVLRQLGLADGAPPPPPRSPRRRRQPGAGK